MKEEQFLISLGCPFSDAVSLCHSLRKERTLDDFMRDLQRPAGHKCNCGERCEHCTCGLR